MNSVKSLVELLSSSKNNIGCAALKELEAISAETDEVYTYFNVIAELLRSDNSYERNRALTLLAVNARWDEDNLFNGVLDEYLSHIIDEKPITSRQCIKGLSVIAKEKPTLAPRILEALKSADVSAYNDSMRPLVSRDIEKAVKTILNFSQK